MSWKEIPDTEKTEEDWDALPDIVVLNVSMCTAAVCAKDGIGPKEIERILNREHPTGISSDWSIDNEVESIPCPDGRKGATHYGLCC